MSPKCCGHLLPSCQALVAASIAPPHLLPQPQLCHGGLQLPCQQPVPPAAPAAEQHAAAGAAKGVAPLHRCGGRLGLQHVWLLWGQGSGAGVSSCQEGMCAACAGGAVLCMVRYTCSTCCCLYCTRVIWHSILISTRACTVSTAAADTVYTSAGMARKSAAAGAIAACHAPEGTPEGCRCRQPRPGGLLPPKLLLRRLQRRLR